MKQQMNDTMEMKIDDTDLPQRIKTICCRAKIITVKNLSDTGLSLLSKHRDIGKSSIDKIKKFFKDNNIIPKD